MPITLVTGVPGTGKTAYIVNMILDAVKTGRPVFVDGVKGLHNSTEFYRCGRVIDWQKGTWLHIDQYIKTDGSEEAEEDSDGSANWLANPDIFYVREGQLEPIPEVYPIKEGQLKKITKRNELGEPVKVVDYESHKGAILFIDEAQRYFRPRPQGSNVPDHVAALEVHRHMGLDFVFITQRPALVDSHLRGLVGRHIALRNGWFGRYSYEWGEVGDIESKSSRDTAARTKYKLDKTVFTKYDSAAVHTTTTRKLPFAAKALMVILPILVYFLGSSYQTISNKGKPEIAKTENPVSPIKNAHASNFTNSGFAAAPPVDIAPVSSVLSVSAAPDISKYQISSCISNSKTCQCYTDRGIKVPLPLAECLASVESVNEKFKLDSPSLYPTNALRP